jgi:Abortive infection alpha
MGTMTPDDLEIAKEMSTELVKQTLAPVQEIVRKVSGPAATEVGLMFGDAVRVWRLKRAVRYLEDVREVASKAGLRLKPVAPRLLFPILDSASLEDDQDLHRRWVALLANAARTDSDLVLPCFPDILRQLTPEEAQFLDRAYDETTIHAETRRAEIRASNPQLDVSDGLATAMGISGRIISSLPSLKIENLERLMLVTRTKLPLSLDDKIVNKMPPANHLYVSELGKAFVLACRIS